MFDFVNSGVQSFLKEDFQKSNNISIAVIGIPRSGTTSIAAGLESVGISFGNNLSNVKEDRNFAKACNSINSKEEIKQYFENRRKSEPDSLIGCKFPDAYKKISDLVELENHINIAVFRDPFSIALRNSKSMFENFDVSFQRALEDYKDYYEQIISIGKKNNLILVSYEKVLTQSNEVFKQIFSLILNTEDVDKKAKRASLKIRINDKKYLMESNLKPRFCIDVNPINKKIIKGWIFYKFAPKRTIKLQIFHNCKFIKEISNRNLRKDLLNKNIHDDGNCGFLFDLNKINEEIDLKQIAVKIKDTSFYLTKNLYSLTK